MYFLTLPSLLHPSILYLFLFYDCYVEMDLPKLVVLAIESAFASGRQLSWIVQENSVGMLVQLVWKSSESRNLVGSNWNKLKK